MFRYVGVIWDPQDAEQSGITTQLRHRLARSYGSALSMSVDVPGLLVASTGHQPGLLEPIPLSGGRGVVLGSLFFRGPESPAETVHRRAALVPSESEAILASGGRRLIDRYWGNYVAFLYDDQQCNTCVIKDPTGSLPCLLIRHRNVHVVFSCVADVAELGLPRPTLNPGYLSHRIVTGRRNQLIGPFNEVSPIERGECLEIATSPCNAQIRRKLLWTPFAFAQSADLIEDPLRAATAVRASVRAATHTWASCSSSVVLRLSGGLDSSIVLACLKDAPSKPQMTCYTLYATEGRGDPRSWARLAAQEVSCRHLEIQVPQLDIDFYQLPRMLPSYEPGGVLTEYIDAPALNQALSQTSGVGILFSGDGGDSVFGSASTSFSVTDYLRLHGLKPRAFRLAAQVAALTGESTFTVLAQSLRRWALGTSMNDRPVTSDQVSLVEPHLLGEVLRHDRYPHPWFVEQSDIPWTRIRQLGMLLSAPIFYAATALGTMNLASVAPLYSQPVVETLLRIPSYVLFHGGRDRGLARRAFVGDVPQPILDRLWKDRAPGSGELLMGRNLRFLRELLLDGILVRERFLNRAAVEQSLLPQPGANRTCAPQMLDYMEIELWAREWAGSVAHRRAA